MKIKLPKYRYLFLIIFSCVCLYLGYKLIDNAMPERIYYPILFLVTAPASRLVYSLVVFMGRILFMVPQIVVPLFWCAGIVQWLLVFWLYDKFKHK